MEKKIKTIAIKTGDIIIFIDDHNEIILRQDENYTGYPKDFNTLHSKVRRLEVLVLSSLSKKNQENYNYLLANNLGEAVEEENVKRALTELNNIEKDINSIVEDNQKTAFSNGTNFALFIILLLLFIFHLCKYSLVLQFGLNTFNILFGSLFGGVGSLIFNYSKSKKFLVNRVIGQSSHFVEGFLRIFYGVIYAFIVIIGIKSGLILNFVNTNDHYNYIIVFIALMSGASDTFIYGIVSSFEKKGIGNNAQKKESISPKTE